MRALAGVAVTAALAGCTEADGPHAGPSSTGVTPGPARAVSAIQHIVVIVQENHTFDNYFATYCQAPVGSNPTCTDGPSCCEAGPGSVPGASAPVALTDQENLAYDPPHDKACELGEMNGGAMDGFVTGPCGDARHFAYADAQTASYYRSLADQYALADRYFQPVAGASSSNDMYLARASWVFDDNSFVPAAVGAKCQGGVTHTYDDPTLGDLLVAAGVGWAFYAEGYAATVAAAAKNDCPPIPADCPGHVQKYPCIYDPGDDPFDYYKSFRDNPAYLRDLADFHAAIAGGTLPPVSFVKAIGYKTEHPQSGGVSTGEAFVKGIVDEVLGAPMYAHDTLVLVTWDESGGFFDHVKPPAGSAVDHQPYGPRVPLIAIGDAARPGHVSHVEMEHSSIVKFIEWNWLGEETGQLGTRDTVVNNLGSLLDPIKTKVPVPEQ
jgi:phospholipase C